MLAAFRSRRCLTRFLKFAEKNTEMHIETRKPERDVPALRHLVSPSGGSRKAARQAGMYLCHQYSGEKVREIGKCFAVGPSAVTAAAVFSPGGLRGCPTVVVG